MSDLVTHVTDATYKEQVLDSPMPILVDFWAPWCGPCRMVAPVIEELAAEYEGKMMVAKVNTDENPKTPSGLGIRGIPTLILYANGQELERIVGFSPKAVLAKKLDAALANVNAGSYAG